jgi:hypothetical protein
MRTEIYGRHPLAKSRNPFTCGLTGKTYSVTEAHKRTDLIAKALSKIMSWEPNADSPWDKVVGVFALNTVSVYRNHSLTSDDLLTHAPRTD